MKFAIIISKKDIAGMNIAKQLDNFGGNYFLIDEDSIYAEDVDTISGVRESDFIIFATKHRSEKGNPSLSLHAPGNFVNADFGGKAGKVCSTSAFVLKYLFQQLNENAKILQDYEVTLECTHHGPLIEKPCCFIELGSSEKQWQDENAAKIIAKTIFALKNYNHNENWIPAIGIGGPHYCPNFNKIQLNSNYAISHIISEYNFPLTKSMLQEAEKKTIEKIKEVIADWKGCGKSEDKKNMINLIKKAGLKYKRTKEVKK